MQRVLGLFYRALALVTASRVAVTGWSMYPTLASGEYVLFNRLAYLWQGPKRGEVVLVRGPQGKRRAIIKRVVGIPGDTVQLERGSVMVNGAALEGTPSLGELAPHEGGLWVLGAKEYFLLGDAPGMSTDSRSFGPLSRKAIRGRAWLVYWPQSRWRWLERE